MAWLKYREIPIGIFTIVTLVVILGYFIDVSQVKTISSTLVTWGSLIALFTLIIGLIIVLRYHVSQIIKKTDDWPFNVVTIMCIFVMLLTGFVEKDAFKFLYVNVVSPISVSILSFVGFYIYSVVYRTYRVKSWEMAVLIISTIGILFTFAPIFEAISPSLPAFGTWINDVPSSGAQSGIMIGVAIGLIAVTIRTILGQERLTGEK